MKKDSTVIDFGGMVIEEVQTSTDTGGKTVKVIERHEHGNGPFAHFSPVFSLFFVLMLGAFILLSFLAWYYMKIKAELARLMVQNNMQPDSLFSRNKEDKTGVSPYLRYGVLLISIGLAFLLVYVLERAGIYKLKVPTLLLFVGAALLYLNRLKK